MENYIKKYKYKTYVDFSFLQNHKIPFKRAFFSYNVFIPAISRAYRLIKKEKTKETRPTRNNTTRRTGKKEERE